MKQCCLCGKFGHESSECKWIPPGTPLSMLEASSRDELSFNMQMSRLLSEDKERTCQSNQS